MRAEAQLSQVRRRGSLLAGFRLRPEVLLASVLVVVLLFIILPPLFFLIRTSLSNTRGALTLEHYANLLSSATSIQLFLNTLVYSICSSLLGLVLGTLVAWLVERTNAPLGRLAYVAAFISLGTAGIVRIIGWIVLLGPNAGILNGWYMAVSGSEQPLFDIYSMAGLIAIEGIIWAPIIFLLMVMPFRTMDPSYEEAALVAGAWRRRIARTVILPLAWPTILSALMLSFIRTFESFEVPVLLGIPAGIEVFTTRIFLGLSRGGLIPDHGASSAFAVILLFLVGLSLIPYARVTQTANRFASITGKGYRPRRSDLGRWRYVAAVPVIAFFLLSVLPLLALVWVSLTPFVMAPSWEAVSQVNLLAYAQLFGGATNLLQSLVNSLIVASATATIAMLVTLLSAWVIVRTTIRWRWLLDQLISFALVFPGVVAAIAVMRTYLALPLPVYGTIWLLVAGYLLRYIPYAMRYSHAGLLRIHSELEECCWVAGASLFRSFRTVVVPLMMPALFAGWIFVFLTTVRELEVALLLSSPSSRMISSALYERWESGTLRELGAFAIVVTIIFVALAALMNRLSARYGVQTSNR